MVSHPPNLCLSMHQGVEQAQSTQARKQQVCPRTESLSTGVQSFYSFCLLTRADQVSGTSHDHNEEE